MDDMKLRELLNEHILDPKNTKKMYFLAREYDKMEQGAAAVSFYIRCADLEENDKILQYKCMIYAGLCYQRQGGRNHTVVGLFQHAIGLLPDRPEGHFFLAKHGEFVKDWRICLIHSRLGLLFDVPDIGLPWPGKKELHFLEAHALWSISGEENGRLKFFNLVHRQIKKYDDEFNQYVLSVLDNIGWPHAVNYSTKDLERFKFKFPEIENIDKNYSKHFQDMFVLACLGGKKNGTYLEVASGHPFIHNNTALLETMFNWKGISVEWSAHLAYDFAQQRNNTIINANALEIDFEELLVKHCMENTIDFLQIDADDSSIQVLRNMPFHRFKFNVIQFGHDAYRLGDGVRQESRRILESHGYQLICGNLCFRPDVEYQDLFVHESIIPNIPKSMFSNKDKNLFWDYMMREV